MATVNESIKQPIPIPELPFSAHDQPGKTYVLAADLSVPDSYPMRFAQALAGDRNADLVLTHMIDPTLCPTPPSATDDEPAVIDREISQHVHDADQREADLHAVEANLREHPPSLLLLGTCAHSHAARVNLGRVARRFSLHCSCPVLVIPPPGDVQLASVGNWKRVLAATDFSLPATTALLLAHHLVLDDMVALHCTSDSVSKGGGRWLELLRFMVPFNESHTVPVMHIVQAGQPGSVIRTVAENLRPDLIVLGAPEEELEAAQLAHSTVCEVIEYAKCPVLLIPQYQPAVSEIAVPEQVCA